jgi:hypothetical protein
VSAYDAISKALSIDFRHSGKFFWIDAIKGVVVISRVHSADKEPHGQTLSSGGAPAIRTLGSNQLPVVDIDYNVTTADFVRMLPSNMYTSLTPAGADPLTTTGKPARRFETYTPAQSGQEASVQASIVGQQLIQATPHPQPPVASVLFGTLDYDGHADKIGTVHDPGWTRTALQALANQLSKVSKSIQATVPLNIMITVGNRMLVRLRFADGVVFNKELFVTQITKTIDQNGPMMQLTFSWRYLETVDRETITDVTRTAPSTVTGNASSQKSVKASPGGWFRIGATLDPTGGQAPTYSAHSGFSFAELLQAGANRGLHPTLSEVLGNSKTTYGMPMETPILIRMPGGSKQFTIYKNDVGSGQAGLPHFKIDLHQSIASALGWVANGDVEVKLP